MGPFLYLKQLIQDRHVASITPTSQVAVERICRNAQWSAAKVVVEYGPGNGVFTRHILRLLPHDARLIAFELNSHLASSLRSTLNDSRCIIVDRSAEHLTEVLDELGIDRVDIIISGIPFSLLSEFVRERIIKRTLNALSLGGVFITYQAFPKPPSPKRPLRTLIEKYFGRVSAEYEFRNIPPLEVICATKRSAFQRARRVAR